MIKEFTTFGYSYHHAAALSGTYAVLALTADATNSPNSAAFPAGCYIDSIEFELSGTAAAEKVTMFLARDSAGAAALTTDQLAGATQAPTIRTGTVGGCNFTVSKDFHYDSGVSNSAVGTIYVVAKVATGASTANIRINWRA
jgi:hypothetical protein